MRGLCPELSRVYSAAEAMATMLRAHQLPQFIAAMETGNEQIAQSICVTVKISLCLLTSVTVVMSQQVAALARTAQFEQHPYESDLQSNMDQMHSQEQ